MQRMVIATALLAACGAEASYGIDLTHANLRARHQTDPSSIPVLDTDVEQPYDVLGDIQVVLRQRGAFGELPTKPAAIEAMRQQAARLGAQAIVLVAFGEPGMSWWSTHELRGHGRAIRFR